MKEPKQTNERLAFMTIFTVVMLDIFYELHSFPIIFLQTG